MSEFDEGGGGGGGRADVDATISVESLVDADELAAFISRGE